MGNMCISTKPSVSQDRDAIYKVSLSKLYPSKPSLKDFTKIKLLGSGAYGNVFLIKHVTIPNLYFAMKVISLKRLQNKRQITNIVNERKILAELNNPFLANLRLAFKDDENLYFITDFAQGGELFYHMKKEQRFHEDKVRFYCVEIIIALEYLHSKKIIYRDLKPENVLLDHKGHVILTDFGLSKMGVDQTNTICGTKNYLAPEIIKGEPYTNAVDWWSLGCLAYEMLSGKPAYNIKSINKNTHQEPPVTFEFFSNDACNFIFSMLEKDPAIRTRKSPRDYRFFRFIKWDRIKLRNFDISLKPPLTGPEDVSFFDKQFIEQDPNNLAYNSTLPQTYDESNKESHKEDCNNDDNNIENYFDNFDFINSNMNGNNHISEDNS